MFLDKFDYNINKHLGLETKIDPRSAYPTRLPPTGSGVKLGSRLKRVEIKEEDRKQVIVNSARIGKAPLATRRRNSGTNTISNVYKSLNRKMMASSTDKGGDKSIDKKS